MDNALHARELAVQKFAHLVHAHPGDALFDAVIRAVRRAALRAGCAEPQKKQVRTQKNHKRQKKEPAAPHLAQLGTAQPDHVSSSPKMAR